MLEIPEDASIEVERVVKKRFATRLKKAMVKKRFPSGHNSKMAIIIKMKDDGTVKRRTIVDLRRGGANAAAKVFERVVLPRDAQHALPERGSRRS